MQTARSPKAQTAPKIPVDTPRQISKCSVEPAADGEMVVHFRIDAVSARRLQMKAGPQDLADHLWNNVLRSAIDSYLY